MVLRVQRFLLDHEAANVQQLNTLSALIYDVTQNVKPGQENALEIIKSAIDNAFRGYEQVTQSTRDAMRRVEEQVAQATSQLKSGGGFQAPTGTPPAPGA